LIYKIIYGFIIINYYRLIIQSHDLKSFEEKYRVTYTRLCSTTTSNR